MLIFGAAEGVWIGKNIDIGENVRIGSNTVIVSHNHKFNKSGFGRTRRVVIGDNCWIGANCCILPGVRLGRNTVVGAGSVVLQSFPLGYCVVAGNPAKRIRSIVPDEEYEEEIKE